jgi:hypothetical protein
MSANINAYLDELFKDCNRVIITASRPFNPKNKKAVEALADIRDPRDIELAQSLFLVDLNSCRGSWMSPVDIYLNFMVDKSLSCSVGVVLGGWLRSQKWKGDYALLNHLEFHRWLNIHHVDYTQHQH